MNILLMTIPVSITLAILFLLFFLSAASDDQFDNLETSAHLPLSDDDECENETTKLNKDIKDLKKQERLT